MAMAPRRAVVARTQSLYSLACMAMASVGAVQRQKLAFAFWASVVLLFLQQGGTAVESRVPESVIEKMIRNICSNETFPPLELWEPAQTALNQLMVDKLISSASLQLSDSSSVSGGNETINGLYQCRGDLNSTECHDCISAASDVALSACPQAVDARVELDSCSLFYQNTSIAPDFAVVYYEYNTYANDSVAFSADRRRLLDKVIADAPAAPGYYSASDDGGVYAFAQCFGFLPPSDCALCLGNASQYMEALAYVANNTGARVMLGSCMLRYESSPFLNPPPSRSQAAAASTLKSILTGISVVGGVAVIVIIAFCLCRSYKSKKKELAKGLPNKIRYFTFEELKKATRGFHTSNVLGQGGFSSVYKYQGTLPDGQALAIKKLAADPNNFGKLSFLAELETITNVRHPNLIKLLGCCHDIREKYLVYEYMPRQSLDKHIFEVQGKQTSTLAWNIRKMIILGTAKGLKHLHHDSQVGIIHRDIKAANILLDEKLEPKIAGFGLARLFDPNKVHETATLACTLGYAPPEYCMRGQLTTKYDVYSFGVLVLEILSGRRALDSRLAKEEFLVKWASVQYKNQTSMDLMDPRLKGEYEEEDARRLIELALACTRTNPSCRPEMSTVVEYLENKGEAAMFLRESQTQSEKSLSDYGPFRASQTQSEESHTHPGTFSTSNSSHSTRSE